MEKFEMNPNYKSPISIILTNATEEMNHRLEDAVFRAVTAYDIHVDKDALMKALTNDRRQYEAGYAAGFRDAIEQVVSRFNCLGNDLKNVAAKATQKFVDVRAGRSGWEDI